ncbi:MAG: hypothetical protein GXP08_12975 [Gammaproteobacteria bacterium]|nr:hypothetical protein [Gammaproteobacteria bacterium]
MKMENAAINNTILLSAVNKPPLRKLQDNNGAASLPSQEHIAPENRKNTGASIWWQLKAALLHYSISEFNSPALYNILMQLNVQYAQQMTGSPQYAQILRKIRSKCQHKQPWLSHCLASDEVLQVNLEAVSEQATPMHSYSGSAGLMLIIEGNLHLTRYTEQVNALTDCSLFSKLVRKTVDQLRPAQGILLKQDTGSIINMYAQQNYCIFFNIFLKDNALYPHYFYYPTYRSLTPHSLFVRRVRVH